MTAPLDVYTERFHKPKCYQTIMCSPPRPLKFRAKYMRHIAKRLGIKHWEYVSVICLIAQRNIAIDERRIWRIGAKPGANLPKAIQRNAKVV